MHTDSAGFDPVPETVLALQTGLTDIIAHRDVEGDNYRAVHASGA